MKISIFGPHSLKPVPDSTKIFLRVWGEMCKTFTVQSPLEKIIVLWTFEDTSGLQNITDWIPIANQLPNFSLFYTKIFSNLSWTFVVNKTLHYLMADFLNVVDMNAQRLPEN